MYNAGWQDCMPDSAASRYCITNNSHPGKLVYGGDNEVNYSPQPQVLPDTRLKLPLASVCGHVARTLSNQSQIEESLVALLCLQLNLQRTQHPPQTSLGAVCQSDTSV